MRETGKCLDGGPPLSTLARFRLRRHSGEGENKILTEAWGQWLRSLDWSYFATGTFTTPRSPPAALAFVRRWLAPWPDAYAVIALATGPTTGALHLHLLLGGFRRVALTERVLRDRWYQLAQAKDALEHHTLGGLALDGYHPRLGAVEYLVRQAEEIELLGDPRPYGPSSARRRRRWRDRA